MDNFINKILKDRYLFKNETTWEDVASRVSRYVASAGIAKGKTLSQMQLSEFAYMSIINNKIFIPNSPTLFNAGLHANKSIFLKSTLDMRYEDYNNLYNSRQDCCLSACFAGYIDDSMKSIINTLNEEILVSKAGGGYGINFSNLRPKGAFVSGTGGTSSGVVSFMELFDTAGKVILQGGKRRCALMGILDYNHPDIIDFIQIKNGDKLSVFNLSVNIDSEAFLKKLQKKEYITLRHEQTGEVGQILAEDFLTLLAENAWGTGDPGIVYMNKHNKYSAISNLLRTTTTNPCGEQFLPVSETITGSCNLGSIDINKVYSRDLNFEDIVIQSVRFLDDVVDINTFPVKNAHIANQTFRNIGLGLMGVHDYLLNQGFNYNSERARISIQKVTAELALFSYRASRILGQQYGIAPAFKESRLHIQKGFIPFKMSDNKEMQSINEKLIEEFSIIADKGIRNMTLNTIAPTGTLSILGECSSGIEPVFAFVYNRKVTKKDGKIEDFKQIHPLLSSQPWWNETKLTPQVIESGSLESLSSIPDHWVTSHEISPLNHLLMQDFAQAYIDNSISKTINLPNTATVKDIEEIYKLSMQLNCKGITVFRDKCLQTQVLTLGDFKRENSLEGVTKVIEIEDGKVYITINFQKNKPVEVFITGDGNVPEFVGRMTSLALSSEIEIDLILKQFKKTGGSFGLIGDTLGNMINSYRGNSNYQKSIDEKKLKYHSKGFFTNENGDTVCPVCSAIGSIMLQEGCVTCQACGYGRCN